MEGKFNIFHPFFNNFPFRPFFYILYSLEDILLLPFSEWCFFGGQGLLIHSKGIESVLKIILFGYNPFFKHEFGLQFQIYLSFDPVDSLHPQLKFMRILVCRNAQILIKADLAFLSSSTLPLA